VSFINIGQGNCTVVDCGNDDRLVVDCGFSQAPDDIARQIEGSFPGVGESTKTKNRKAEIIKRLASYAFPDQEKTVIFISHSDDDHLNLIKSLLPENTVPHTFILGGPASDYFKKDHTRGLINAFKRSKIVFLSHHLTAKDIQDLLDLKDRSKIDEELNKKPLRGHFLKKLLGEIEGVNLREFCPQLALEVISANAGQGLMRREASLFPVMINDDSNTNSAVLKVTGKNGQSIILTGDATGITTDQIIKYYNDDEGQTPDLRADVMLACHHGSSSHESNNERWVDATSPQSTIFSCATMHDHPICEIVDKYEAVSTISVPSHPIRCGSIGDPITNREKAVYSTHDSGTITATFEGGRINLVTERSGSVTIPARMTGAGGSSAGAGAASTPGDSSAVVSNVLISAKPPRTPGKVADGMGVRAARTFRSPTGPTLSRTPAPPSSSRKKSTPSPLTYRILSSDSPRSGGASNSTTSALPLSAQGFMSEPRSPKIKEVDQTVLEKVKALSLKDAEKA
jgi:hypothetical protein